MRVEKEVLEVDFKNEEESKRTLYERIIKSRKVFVSDPRRNQLVDLNAQQIYGTIQYLLKEQQKRRR